MEAFGYSKWIKLPFKPHVLWTTKLTRLYSYHARLLSIFPTTLVGSTFKTYPEPPISHNYQRSLTGPNHRHVSAEPRGEPLNRSPLIDPWPSVTHSKTLLKAAMTVVIWNYNSHHITPVINTHPLPTSSFWARRIKPSSTGPWPQGTSLTLSSDTQDSSRTGLFVVPCMCKGGSHLKPQHLLLKI